MALLKSMRRRSSWLSALREIRSHDVDDLAVMWRASDVRQACAWLESDRSLLVKAPEVRSYGSLLVSVLRGQAPPGTPDFLRALKPAHPTVLRMLQVLESRLVPSSH